MPECGFYKSMGYFTVIAESRPIYCYFLICTPVQINGHMFAFFSVIYNEQVIIWKFRQFRIYTACDTGIWKLFEIALAFNFGSIFITGKVNP